MWQLAKGELDKSVKTIMRKGNRQTMLSTCFLFFIVLLVIFWILGSSKKTETEQLIYQYTPLVSRLNVTNYSRNSQFNQMRLSRLEKELEDNGEYLRDVEQMEDAYRIKYISVVFLYILLCLLVYHYYYSKEKELKDEQVLFCKGTCIERDWREISTKGEYNVKCHLSIMLEDGNIMRKIQLAPYSGKDIEIGQNIVLY